jgi:hypothetical protein
VLARSGSAVAQACRRMCWSGLVLQSGEDGGWTALSLSQPGLTPTVLGLDLSSQAPRLWRERKDSLLGCHENEIQ